MPALPPPLPASASKRLAAALFDRILFALVAYLAFFLAVLINPIGTMEWANKVPGFWVLLGIWFVYCAGLEAARGATLGKRLVGCKVVQENGEKIGLLGAVRRFWSSGFNWLALGLLFVMILWRPDRRGFHDLVAGSHVVDADPAKRGLNLAGKIILTISGLLVIGVVIAVFSIRAHFA